MANKFFDRYKKDIHEFNCGESTDAYKFMGAHITDDGVSFAVWAPNAREVYVCGDFNSWDKNGAKMSCYNGIWHINIPDAREGDAYKYRIVGDYYDEMKSDPFAFCSEIRPETASIIKNVFTGIPKPAPIEENIYKSPMNIYEVHLGSFMTKAGKFFTYRELAPKLTNYLLEMGYNYLEIMPLCEYPLDASWGYQTTGYYSLTSRYGSAEDFKFFVNFLHDAGIKIIMDWVPGHFCRDAHGLYRFDGTHLYEDDNKFKADNPGWGTANFDFSRPQVRSFLISNALFWLKEYGIDGIRVDAVANMLFYNFCKDEREELKNQYGGFENISGMNFIKQLNSAVHEELPHAIMCAEDSSDLPNVTKYPSDGGLGFNFKWNMGWMNDSLSYMCMDPIFRKGVHKNLTFALCYAFNENFILPLSHDEVVHGKCSLLEKMPGYRKDKFAQLRCFLTYMYGMPGKKLMFMGGEFGHSLEWRFYEELEWGLLKYPEYSGMKFCSSAINHLYLNNSSLWDNDSWDGFKWCDPSDSARSILSFARISEDNKNILVFVCNFTPVKREGIEIGVPEFYEYTEVFNSDSSLYGGDNILNRGLIKPRAKPVGEMPYSVKIDLPPFGGVVLEMCKL